MCLVLANLAKDPSFKIGQIFSLQNDLNVSDERLRIAELCTVLASRKNALTIHVVSASKTLGEDLATPQLCSSVF